ncbi:MAG: efflux RND transporter permease subunit, partial [Spirochaetales bacterium]|nr:efflux RND transporter permease subunit [Spirochaetales bacterium]
YIQDQGNSDTRVEITLIGSDDIYLKRKAKEVAEELLSKPFISRTVLHFKKGDPELVYRPKRDQMIKSGVNLEEVISFLRWGIHGPVSLKWLANGKERDLRIVGDEAVFDSLEKIKNASITIEGRPTLLQTIGTFSIMEGRGRIYRLNRQRSVSLSIHTHISNLNKISNLLEMAVSEIPMKEGHVIRIDPSLKELSRQYKFLIAVLLLTILIIYMVLASQYESFITPFLIIITIPLSLSFPLGVLFLLGKAISINTVIALIVVTGLVVNNSILIVDGVQNYQKCQFASQKILWGLRKRLKPMLLTTGSTILGVIPLILPSISPSPLIRHLSLVVLTGIAGSTLIALFIIPALLNKFPIFTKIMK